LKHQPECKSRDYHIYILDRFHDGEIFVEVRCVTCGATTKGRFHPENFVEVLQ
jgi:hypothetical protein